MRRTRDTRSCRPKRGHPRRRADESGRGDAVYGRIVPVYEKTGHLTSEDAACSCPPRAGAAAGRSPIRCPTIVGAPATGIVDRRTAIHDTHFRLKGRPRGPESIRSPAQRRMIFEESFLFSLGW